MPNKRKVVDLNTKYGFLSPIKENGINRFGNIMYLCLCDCGVKKSLRGASLVSEKVISCGCKKYGNNKTHGMSGTRIYRIWSGIKKRCYYEKCDKYQYYGGKGIRVCDEWRYSFENFYQWAINNGYDSTLTIERNENDKDYMPSNCRWATIEEQGKNKTNSRRFFFDGRMQSPSEISKKTGLKKSTIYQRLSYGWSEKEAFSVPAGPWIHLSEKKHLPDLLLREVEPIN